MTRIRTWRPTLGLTFVLSVYWVPVLIALRWGIWHGGDPIELGLALGQTISHDWTGVPLATWPLAPFVVIGTATAVFALIRGTSGPPPARRIDVATVVLATPYLLLALFYLVVLTLIFIGCGLKPCAWF